MTRMKEQLELDVDLQHGVVPISKAASSLAALLRRSREKRQPIIVTQKGYPAGVILDVEIYTALRALAARTAAAGPQVVGADPAEVSAAVETARPALEREVSGAIPMAEQEEAPEDEPVRPTTGRRRSRS